MLLCVNNVILSIVLTASLGVFAEEIIGDLQREFWRNRSTSDRMLTVRQLLEMKWEHCELMYQLFVEFKKVYDSIIKAKMYESLVELGIPEKLVNSIRVSLNNSQGRVRIDNEPFNILSGLK